MATAQNGDKVRVHYTGRLTNGEVFDSSEGREPLEFEVGAGQMIPGFDAAIPGMETGEHKTVTIPSDQAYGAWHDEHTFRFERNQLPEGMEVHEGMQLPMETNDGQQFMVMVKEITEEDLLLDANHPLAGQDLIFDIQLVDINAGASRIIMP